MLSEDYQKCTCELAKASLCLSFFSFTTTLHLGLFPAVNCLFFNPVVSPFSHNPVSLWACFSTSPPSHHPSSLSFHMLLSPLLPHLPSRQCSSLLFLPFFPSHPSISFLCPCHLNVFFFLLSNCPSFSLPPLLHPSPSLPPPCSVRDKFVEVDLKPMCKHCYERLPDDMKRRLAKRERESKEKKKKLLIPMCL